MPRLLITRDTAISGAPVRAGATVEASESDAFILQRLGKAEPAPASKPAPKPEDKPKK